MGAEIIKTVLVRELQELIILAFIIALRAGLAVLIHWEIKLEKKECEEHKEIVKKVTKEVKRKNTKEKIHLNF